MGPLRRAVRTHESAGCRELKFRLIKQETLNHQTDCKTVPNSGNSVALAEVLDKIKASPSV